MKDRRLPDAVRALVDSSLSKGSRVHRLPSEPSGNLWIKREDELSSGISGSKLRKYASLIPALKQRKVETVGMIGGPNSNNLVGLAQLLRENGIKPIAFIREAADTALRGNALLLDMLIPHEQLLRIPRSDWKNVERIATRYLAQASRGDEKWELLLEGCFGLDALPGALTLAEDILINEEQLSVRFQRIYIDCGTGLTAIGLILGLDLLSAQPREIVVTLIAENQETFLSKLELLRRSFGSISGRAISLSNHIRFLTPIVAPKFGAVNKTLFQSCRAIAREEGLLMDPTYSVKHFVTARADLAEKPSDSASLFVFNGSPLGIAGFQDQLADPNLPRIAHF